jgi:pimeloyl-ACP methyl ester carboxylesterase
MSAFSPAIAIDPHAAAARGAAAHSPSPFGFEMLRIDDRSLRVGRQAGSRGTTPLLLFHGIGGNIELLTPLARRMPARELITFDIPGVRHSELPALPYRLPAIAALASWTNFLTGPERSLWGWWQ